MGGNQTKRTEIEKVTSQQFKVSQRKEKREAGVRASKKDVKDIKRGTPPNSKMATEPLEKS